jgi:chromatin structure-remodeling complex subunit RSC9
MHENFVYSSTSSVLQVTFWHAYRDFFTSAAPQDPMLSASEVIKNVTVAFPCASPKVLQDPTGNKFVIWGLGWRKGSGISFHFVRVEFELMGRRHSAIHMSLG